MIVHSLKISQKSPRTFPDLILYFSGAKMSVVAIGLHDNSGSPVCSVFNITGGAFTFACTTAPANGTILGYVLMTPP